eukprot:8019819-Karenia_brevis.AAC.1
MAARKQITYEGNLQIDIHARMRPRRGQEGARTNQDETRMRPTWLRGSKSHDTRVAALKLITQNQNGCVEADHIVPGQRQMSPG